MTCNLGVVSSNLTGGWKNGEVPEFYDDGLKFECRRCSACCRHEPGVVFLKKGEAEKIAAFLNMAPGDFFRVYCRLLYSGEGRRVSLKEKSGFDCIFWNNGCGIYPVRPVQCASYPFWPHLTDSEEAWNAEASRCPGIGNGKTVTAAEICRRRDLMKGEFDDGTEF